MNQAYDIVEFNYALCDNAPPERFFNKEKFAELIVRECAELVEYNSKGAGRDIREHFGVSE